MNIKPRPTFLSDMLVGNFGELTDNFFANEFINSKHTNKPAIEVKEMEAEFEVKVALPGVKKEDISIEVEDNRLKITGETKSNKETNQNRTHVSEFIYGQFERTVLLPKNADFDKIEATLEDGILKISIPKQEVLKPKNIVIK